MKKSLLILCCLICSFVDTNAQTFGRSQAVLNIKKTADWCTNCGTYGWTYFKDVQTASLNSPSILIAMHYSGGLANGTAEDLNANFVSGGQPVFLVDGVDAIVGSSTWQTKVNQFKTYLTNKATVVPDIYVALKIFQNGTAYYAQVDTENSKALNAEYTVSLFVLRDNLIASQASVGANASHINILSARLTTNTFGPTIMSGSQAAGVKRTLRQDFAALPYHNTKPSDTKIAAIVWKKETNGKYTFVNGTVTPMSQVTSAEEVALGNGLVAYQSGSELVLSSEQTFDNSTIQLYNTNGQLVKSISNVFGKEIFIPTEGVNSGLYLVKVNVKGTEAMTKVMIKN